MRLDSSCLHNGLMIDPCVVMDVNYQLIPKPSHDFGLELDMVRNDARYGPRLATTLIHRNPRGWGAENAWELGFGYVAVSPFATLGSAAALNSAEWTLRWSTSQIGILPLPLVRFRPSTEPYTTIDVGWDREVWPEFTRSQIHLLYDVGFTENPERESKFHISPMEVSYVSLTNRSESFESWLDDGLNPRVRARFNNHMTFGSAGPGKAMGSGLWHGQIQVQAHWAGMMAQRLAENVAESAQFDPESGAWLVAPASPSSSTKEACLKPVPRDMPKPHGATLSTCCLAGPMQGGTPRHFLWNRPFSPEVPMAFVDGGFGPWGPETPRSTNPMLGFWGWVMCGLTFNMNCGMHSTNNGILLGSPMLATFGCTAKETTRPRPGPGNPCRVGAGELASAFAKTSSFSFFG